MTRLRAGLIGFGAVGRAVAGRVASGDAGDAEIAGILVRDPARRGADSAMLGLPFVGSVAELIALRPDVVVEAGGHDAFRQHVPALLEAGIDVLAISVGALANPDLITQVREASQRGGGRVRVPSGAIAGLDAISSAAVGQIARVTHTVRKPPATLLDGPAAVDVVRSGRPLELYAGPAREAVVRFPANVNVVAAVALAGIGFERTEARVIADPGVTRNTHEVEVEGDFGRLALRIENEPSENPKTGRIVALSLVRALRAHGEAIIIGG
jgi:aspartate dehydrogenase